MPLPPELDQKIRARFDVLILEANDLISRMEAYAEEQRRIEREGTHGVRVSFQSALPNMGMLPNIKPLS